MTEQKKISNYMLPLYNDSGYQTEYKVKVNVNNNSVFMYLVKSIVKDSCSDNPTVFHIVMRKITVEDVLNLQDDKGKPMYLRDESMVFIETIHQNN